MNDPKTPSTESSTLAVVAVVALLLAIFGGIWLLGTGVRTAARAETLSTYRTEPESIQGETPLPWIRRPSPNGAWGIDYFNDTQTGFKHKSAYTIQEDGYRFAIYRLKGRVYGTFMLPGDSLETMDSQLPALRVDHHKALDLNTLAWAAPLMELQTGVKVFVQKPTWVTFHVHNGESEPTHNEILSQIMRGGTLRVSYTTSSGGAHQVAFGLRGSFAAVREVLDSTPR